MKKTEQTYIDKSSCPDGAWKNEPDRVSWVDQETGYHCLIKRSEVSLSLCGYVSIPKNHTLQGKSYEDGGVLKLSVHGGITYGNPCDEDPIKGICHLTESQDEFWWLGFDCAHGGDLCPSLLMLPEGFEEYIKFFSRGCTYKDISYVTSEVESLAKQLKEIESKKTCRRENNEIS